MTSESIEQPTNAQPSDQIERVNAILDALLIAKEKSQQLTARDIARRSQMGIDKVRLILPELLRRDWIIERMRPEKRLEIYELSELGELVASGAHTCPDCGMRCDSEERVNRHVIKCHGAGAPRLPDEEEFRMQAAVMEDPIDGPTQHMPEKAVEPEPSTAIVHLVNWQRRPNDDVMDRGTILIQECCPKIRGLIQCAHLRIKHNSDGEMYLDAEVYGILTGMRYCPFCRAEIKLDSKTYYLQPATTEAAA